MVYRTLLLAAIVYSLSVGVSDRTFGAERYRLTFTATWTETSHPVDFPDSAHWSPLIGGVHNDKVVFWEPGGVATPGIQLMAELGTTGTHSNEVTSAISAGNALAVVRGRAIPRGDGVASVEFDVTEEFPLVTLTSMVAPSPDWFVGVHGLSTRNEDRWIGKTVVDMYPYDAGTDSGATFNSRDLVTTPRGTIHRIDSAPLENPKPMGTFTLLRLIPHDYNDSGEWDSGDMDQLSAAVRSGSTDLRFDVNGDQKIDSSDRLSWITDLAHTCIGDSNLDGAFTSGDFVEVFTAGEYEDSTAGNSTWATGDWNGDGEFDSSDFVEAFQAGCYETVAAAQPVPEPMGVGSLIVGIGIFLAGMRQRSAS